MPAGALEGIRVVDAASNRAELAGRVLADLGAEVVKIEPPEGAEARRCPPFEGARSLYWAAVALGKRSVVLDLGSELGAAQLRELLRGADVFIESFDPGALPARGLDYPSVRELNPSIVYASITPFGQDGPLANAPACDLTLEAAGGLVGLQGDPDRPPIPVGFPQASFHAGVQAAADIVIALCERLRSGEGQHLDVSTQAAVVWTLMNATGYPPNTGRNPPGTSEFRGEPARQPIPGLRLPYRIQCADGHALVGLGLGEIGQRTMHALMSWAGRSGALPEALESVDWRTPMRDALQERLEKHTLQAGVDAVLAFLATRSKRELLRFAVEHETLMAPVLDVADLRADPQLRARGYWVELEGRRYPGPFARLSETPLELTRAAPSLGEAQNLLAKTREPLGERLGGPDPEGIFAGIRVADFAWVGVGPLISKALSDHGATVVHVESESRLDILRQAPPFKDGKSDINGSQFVANFNTSKLGLALDLATEGGKELAHRLADWADVVVESFTPGTMSKLGLDYATLSVDRPDLVMLSTCLRGQTGPERGYTGFGNQGAALAGIVSITGWPDRPPFGPWGAYTDFIAPRYAVAALAAALFHRARTGRGQHVDVSQVEAAIHFIEPLLLDYLVNGKVAGPVGYGSPTACPHGVYRTAGHHRYLALAVERPEQWDALRSVMPLVEFASPELRELEERRARRDEIDARIASFCADRDAFLLADRLRAAGVPAYAVLRPSDLYRDPQLAHRGFFQTLAHTTMGPTPYDGPVTRFSRTPARLRSAGPTIGEHTYPVLRDLLGLSEDEISNYAASGALS